MSKARELAQAIIPRRNNLIINGGFDIAQRGTSFAAVANGQYTLDRWLYNKSGGVFVHTLSQAQNSSNLDNYFVVNTTTGEASPISSTSHCMVSQCIEGYVAEELALGTSAAKTVTLSFQHAHSVTGTYCVAFRNDANNRSYVAEYTQSVANAWETAEITVALDTTGTWLTWENVGLRVGFTIASATTYQTTAGSWKAGNYIATANQVNGAAAASDVCRFAKVQLEIGTEATDFAFRHYSEELNLCQRYYEKSYHVGYTPGVSSGEPGSSMFFISNIASNTHYAGSSIHFKVRKCGIPSMTAYSPTGGAAGKARDWINTADITLTWANIADTGAQWSILTGAAQTAINIHVAWVANAELT